MGNPTIDTRPLPEQICDYLIDLINTGVLRPGQPLRLSYLCKEYGLTQTPLREALRQLASDGLVKYAPRRGYRVVEITEQELVALYEVREALEGMAARRAAEQATDDQLRELLRLATESDQPARQKEQKLTIDRKFHRLVAGFSGNPLIPKLLLAPSILTSSKVQLIEPLPSDYDSYIPHEAVASAIASGDPHQAEAVMRKHIRHAAQVRLTQLSTLSVADVAQVTAPKDEQ